MTEEGNRTSETIEWNLPRREILQSTLAIGLGSTLGTCVTAGQTDASQLLWSTEIGRRISSSPTVANETVFVGNKNNNLYAVDAVTGDHLWVYETGDDIRDSSPTVVDGTVYTGSYDANLHAVNAESGEAVWTFETGVNVNSSPIVADGIVFVGSRDRSLYAIDAETGEQIWRFQTDDEIRYSSPTVVDGTVYIGSNDSHVYAIDAATGEQEWRFETNVFPTAPTVKDGTVYVSTKITHSVEEDGMVYALDAESGSEQWSYSANGSFNSPTVADGTVFIGNTDENLYALDVDSGEEIWTYETHFADRGIHSTPTVADRTVFFSYEGNPSEDRGGGVCALDTASGVLDWQWFETNHYMMESSPAVANGVVYVGSHDGSVYALDAGVAGRQGSRQNLGTLGHNDEWEYSNQTIDISPQTDVTLSVPETVEPGESFRVEGTAKNRGVVPDQTGATLSVDDETVDSVDSIGAAEAITLGSTVDAGESGIVHAISIESQHDSETIELRVSSPETTQEGTENQQQNGDTEQEHSPTETSSGPTASFTYTPSSPSVEEQVAFNASESTSATGQIVSYEWEFDDGQTGTGQTVSHTYTAAGGYNFQLTITDGQDRSDSVIESITVTDESENETDASGPGFGIGTSVAGFGGALYLLKQFFRTDDPES